MPKNSKVHKVYEALLRAGKIAQAKTGQSLKTGKRPKRSK